MRLLYTKRTWEIIFACNRIKKLQIAHKFVGGVCRFAGEKLSI
jgi:hypothetical protein